MDDMSTKSSMSGFAYYLFENKMLDRQVGLEALKQAALDKISYFDYLVKHKLLDAARVAKATSEYFGLPLCDITAFDFSLIPTEYLNINLVRKRMALPLFVKNGFLYLAITDPTIENLYDIRFLTGLDTRLLVTDGNQLTQVIDNLLNKLIISEISRPGSLIRENLGEEPHKEDTSELATYDAESAPVVNYVNKIIIDAIEKGASDIHFERYDNDYRIRYRLNGVLYPVATPPIKLANYLLARIKIMSNLDITEHRIPQDGRFKLTLSKYKTIDFRVSVCPALYGEKIVLRLLDPTQIFHNLNELGMEEKQQEILLDSLGHTQGIILVTGPTGSGKTVTLYSALNYLNSPDDNIMTVEDPVEIPLHGVNQVHVNPKVGLTFSSALRSFLRQDPDIIMVGEIRDLETAQISIQAAQTGHLVLSTLHTNSGPETIARLMYMGVEPYNLASSLILVIAQRLLRMLCPICKQVEELPEDILIKEGFKPEEIGTFQLYKPGSCERCIHGFTGRSGIFEVMPISEEMRFLMIRGANAIELNEQAKKENIRNLRQAGLDKVKMGKTSLAELNRTFK
ncbi:Type II secretion system protein E [Aquicella siphonis]|uniref:Type II secretion system protein E n=2 Tax=Aquicella siphonis TaxID=254247 RepID=A0A5E4PKX5_9COXI|nr:Type II secretion system protein E [Aquicella siphonis]